MIKSESLKYFLWSAGVTSWLTLCFIVPYFLEFPTEDLVGILSVIAYITVCGIGTFFLVYLIGSCFTLCVIFLPILSLLGSALSFYLVGYHTTLTPVLIDVTLHTNVEEAIGVISWQVLLWALLNLCIATIFIWLRKKRIKLSRAWIYALIAIAVGTLYFSCSWRLRNSLCQRFPYNIPHTLYEYISIQHTIHANRETPLFEIKDIPDSLKVVLILGEAARADHLQLNGYERETTPRLIKRKNIVSYPHIYSEQTHTLASIPYILTRADSTHEQYQYSETSFISIFKQAGYETSWISNQDLGSTFSPFMSECDTTIFANAGKSVYVFTKWVDGDLMPIFHSLCSSSPARSVYIMHTIGSHWYYNNHVPDSMCYFQPITTNKMVTANTIEQFINSYDNTIRYMDYFVDSVISSLEHENAIVFYQSDHGEALGEDGEYLHANETEMAKHPACFIWYSDTYQQTYPDKIKALIANKDKRFRTDYVFYSILSAAGIEAEGDCPNMNILSLNP